MPNPISLQEIKDYALSLGWDDAGATFAAIPEEDIAAYQEWLSDGHHAGLAYMENTMRCQPQELLPGARSAIIFVSYYRQERLPFRKDAGLISAYARGKDYHHIHRKRLKKFIGWLENRSGQNGIAKGFSDSSPILEKALAVQAGLGWFGKNTLLIHRRFGTFIFLSGVLTTLEIEGRITQMRLPRCGTCTRCLDACPTQALVAPYHLDAAKCLSFHLIESKQEIPAWIKAKNPGYVFGCDICQDACPHNIRKELSAGLEFKSEAGHGPYLTLEIIDSLKENPEKLHGTPLQRRGVDGLNRNLHSILNDINP